MRTLSLLHHHAGFHRFRCGRSQYYTIAPVFIAFDADALTTKRCGRSHHYTIAPVFIASVSGSESLASFSNRIFTLVDAKL